MKKQAMNPFLPLFEYVPDTEPRIFNDRLYLYGSHDCAGAEEFCVKDYVVYSAPLDDLSDWKLEGTSYTYHQTGASLQEAGNLAAPDCVQGIDGRYYLYYNRGARMNCEVAVSNTPAGPFEYLADVQYKDGTFPSGKQFDPGVLVDDGHVYLYTGFVPTPDSPWINVAGKYSMGFELEADMFTIKTGPVEVLPGCLAAKNTPFENHGFYEASSPRKINGKYYLIYSSEQSHDLCYAVSDFPLHGYNYKGILISNADIGLHGNTQPKAPYGNTHGGIVEINNQWYVFYHRQTHGIECCRQCCGEKIFLDENGNFSQVEITSCGLNQGPLQGKGTYNASYACNIMHPSIHRLSVRECVRHIQPHIFEELNEGKTPENAVHYIANIQNETVVGFKYFEIDNLQQITLCLCSTQAGTANIYTHESCEIPIATVSFAPCTAWQNFSACVSIQNGVYPLYLRFETNGVVNWKEFTLK